jgi:cytochrome P450
MKQLDVINHLESVFGRRQLRNHAGQRGVTTYADADLTIWIVKDLSVSRQILTSKSFQSFNYFEDGYRHFTNSNASLDLMRRHFRESPLFLEGEEHRSAKQAFAESLRRQGEELTARAPEIRAYMTERKDGLDSAVDFAHAFVEICLAMVIGNLSCLPLKISLSALRARNNVFYFYFHPKRQQGANEALGILEQSALRADEASATNHELLLCQSILLMAYDPLVATICASIAEGRTRDLAKSAGLYCSTSFVSRVCVEPVSIGTLSLQKGDVCYVSLLPAVDESADNTFPFGAGRHICVGKRISLQILELAEEIIAADFKDGFRKNPILSPDGAFLSFRN